MSLKLQNAVIVSVSFCERNWSDLLHYYYVLLHCLLFKCNSRTYYDFYILYYSNVNLEPSWNVLTTTKCCYSLCFFFVKEIEVTWSTTEIPVIILLLHMITLAIIRYEFTIVIYYKILQMVYYCPFLHISVSQLAEGMWHSRIAGQLDTQCQTWMSW